MMKNKILIILLLLTAFFGIDSKAQENLLQYGDFEEFVQTGLGERPKGWIITGTLFGMKREGSRPGGTGANVLHIYTNGGTLQTFDGDAPDNLKVQEGKVYRLTFWHKGNKKGMPIKVRFSWYKDDQLKDRSPESAVKTGEDWVNDDLYFSVPTGQGINRGELRFTIGSDNNGQISFDDVEVFVHEGAIPEPLVPPTNIRATTYQREIDLTWDRASDPKVTWEVTVNGQIYKDIKTNAFTIEQRDPNRNYAVAVRSVSGEKRSDFSQVSYYKTKPFEKSLDAPERTPYLRTIEADGRSLRRIKPYFNDLGSSKAVITYSINGEPAELRDGYITFPGKGNHRLTVTIDEGNGHKFKLTYRLSIIN